VRIIKNLIIVVIALLSISSGLAKVMQVPQEMEFLQSVGLSRILIIVFGLVLIAGGVLLAPKKTRTLGAVIVASAFVVSTVLIFMGGNSAFGLFSILPIALAGVVIYEAVRFKNNTSLNVDNRVKLPARADFPEGSVFYIKEFDIPLVFIPNVGWVNWYGGRPSEYDPSSLKVDNNWLAESFEEWVALVAESS